MRALAAIDPERGLRFLLAHLDDPRYDLGYLPQTCVRIWRIGTDAARSWVIRRIEETGDVTLLAVLVSTHRHPALRACAQRLRERGDAKGRWDFDRVLAGMDLDEKR
jgi:hypothetical protein